MRTTFSAPKYAEKAMFHMRFNNYVQALIDSKEPIVRKAMAASAIGSVGSSTS